MGQRLTTTVLGPVRCGKTCLAIDVAHEGRAGYPGGVWFVDLSEVIDDRLVAERIAATVLPLGVELAAVRVRAFELHEIVDGLDRDPDSISRIGRGVWRQLTLHEGVEWSHRPTRHPGRADRPPPPRDASAAVHAGRGHRRLTPARRPCNLLRVRGSHRPPTARAGGGHGVLARSAEVGNDFAAMFAAIAHAVAALLDDDPREGLRRSNEILRCQIRLGFHNAGDFLEQRGGHYANAGQPLDAVRGYAAGRAHQLRGGRSRPRLHGTAKKLARLRESLSAPDYDRAWQSGQRLGIREMESELT